MLSLGYLDLCITSIENIGYRDTFSHNFPNTVSDIQTSWLATVELAIEWDQ